MSKERFVRWQGYTMTQMSVVVALLGALSLAALAFSMSLAQDTSFKPVGCQAVAFVVAAVLFLVSTLCSVGANLTRLLDFRLTAKKVRGAEAVPEQFGADSDGYGRATWFLVWVTVYTLLAGVVLLAWGVLPSAFARVLSGAGL